MKRVRFHPEAQVELVAESVYYEAHGAGLGERFIAEVQRVVLWLSTFPDMGSPHRHGTRRAFPKSFPFSVVYRAAEDEVVILAIAPFARRPGYWRDRTHEPSQRPSPWVTLLRAEASDREFSFRVTESALREHVEKTWGTWDIETQRVSHDDTFDPETHRIVLVDGVASGILAVKEAPGHLQVEKFYLLPHARGRGIGAQLLEEVAARSVVLDEPVRLSVLAVNNAAQRFYARHGFVVTAATPERVFMEARFR